MKGLDESTAAVGDGSSGQANLPTPSSPRQKQAAQECKEVSGKGGTIKSSKINTGVESNKTVKTIKKNPMQGAPAVVIQHDEHRIGENEESELVHVASDEHPNGVCNFWGVEREDLPLDKRSALL